MLLHSISSVAAVAHQLLRSSISRRRQWSRDDELGREGFFTESVFLGYIQGYSVSAT